MRVALLIAASAIAAFAQQPACIQISQTLYVAGPLRPVPMNGTITLDLPYTAQNLAQSETLIQVTGGRLSTCQPAGVTIPVHYSVAPSRPLSKTIEFDRIWTVPASGGPYELTDTPPGASGPIESQPPLPGAVQTMIPVPTPGLRVRAFPVTASTSVSIPAATHGLGANVIVQCEGVAECGGVQIAADGAVTVQSRVAWTGTIYVFSAATNYSLVFSNALAAAVSSFQSGLWTVYAAACYDAGGNQFGAGNLSISPHSIGIGGTWEHPSDFSITLSSSAPVTGRCVLLGD